MKSSLDKLSFDFDSYKDNSLLITNDIFNHDKNYFEENLNLKDHSIKDEVQMINDFIEFKFFKNIRNENKKNNKK